MADVLTVELQLRKDIAKLKSERDTLVSVVAELKTDLNEARSDLAAPLKRLAGELLERVSTDGRDMAWDLYFTVTERIRDLETPA